MPMGTPGGSPAHAGMVPQAHNSRVGGSRFPRPRGDGPSVGKWLNPSSSVPPPTRGWSVAEGYSGRSVEGSPAHAGMVPAAHWQRSPAGWFPRPRGDGPVVSVLFHACVEVPPPTRGWSPSGRADRCTNRGSPAHAGMVPCQRQYGGRSIGLHRCRFLRYAVPGGLERVRHRGDVGASEAKRRS